ncbi:adenylate/guanylate cyclase domain-containing protein [Thiocapsa imhoffii]|nr:adenylate/guanylate cyclase domain-containing protein [Thiocapsa imhoffii]
MTSARQPSPSFLARRLPRPRISFRVAILMLFLIPMMATVMAIVYKMSERAEMVVYQLSSRIVEEVGAKIVARATGIVRVAEGHLLANTAVASATRVIPGQVVLADLFWQQVAFSPELAGMYIADLDGNFVQARTLPEPATRVIDRTTSPPTDRIIVRDRDYRPLAHLERPLAYDPRDRPWFMGTQPERRLQWTDAYRFSDSGRLGITATYPLLDSENRILAVLGVDATLESLSAFLSQQTIGPRSAAFLLDDRDRIIAAPHALEILDADALRPAAEIELDWVRNALTAIQTSTSGGRATPNIVRSVTDGQGYLTHLVTFGEGFSLPWRLVIVVSEADLLSEAQRILQESIVISAIIVILALFVIYPLSATFAESVAQLTHNTWLLRHFRPAEVIPVRSVFSEIQELDRAMQSMRDAITLVEGQLPTEVVRQLSSGAARVELQAEFKTITVLTSALNTLDPLFDHLQPEQVIAFLRAQIEHGRFIVTREDGTLEAFRGDRIHAFWDTPAAPDLAARHACRAALSFVRSCQRDLLDHRVEEPIMRCSGIHLGRGLVGNLGVGGRLRYSSMGRLVETAARLRDANSTYGTAIILSATVQREVKDRFRCRVLDAIRLPGDPQATPIYELRGDLNDRPDEREQTFIDLCETGFSQYRERHWDAAIAAWTRASTLIPGDQASALMIARCAWLKVAVPGFWTLPEDWDGAFPGVPVAHSDRCSDQDQDDSRSRDGD